MEKLKYRTCTYTSLHSCIEKICQPTDSHEEILYNLTINYPKKLEYEDLFRKRQFNPNLMHILIPSRGRSDTARLNWNHMLLINKKEVVPYIQIVFVCPDEFKEYKDVWKGHCAIVKLPETLQDVEENVYVGGIGYSRRLIQHFASWFNIPFFFMADDNIVYLKHGAKDENVISFKKLYDNVSMIGSVNDEVPENHMPFQPHQDVEISKHNTLAAYSGPFQNFGIIGFRKTRGIVGNFKSWHAKKHCCSLLLINNKMLLEKKIFYKPWKCWEDLNFCNETENNDLIVLKLNVFGVTKQRATMSSNLYTWDENDKTSSIESYQGDKKSIEKLMLKFLKSLRISKPVYGEQFFDAEIKYVKEGTVLYWIKTLDELKSVVFKSQNITLVLPMKLIVKSKWSNLEEIKSWLSFFKINEAEKINVTLKSTHKPVVLNDFAVISITYSLQKSNQHDNKEYLQMFEQLKAENAEMKTKINLLHIHKVETESKMKILQEDNSKVSSQVDKLQSESSKVEAEQASKMKTLEEKMDSKISVEVESKLTKLKEECEQRILEIKKYFEEEERKIHSENEALSYRMQNLETRNSNMETRDSNMETRLSQLEQKINEQFHQIKQEQDVMKDAESDQEERISKIEELYAKLEEVRSDLRAKIDDLKQKPKQELDFAKQQPAVPPLFKHEIKQELPDDTISIKSDDINEENSGYYNKPSSASSTSSSIVSLPSSSNPFKRARLDIPLEEEEEVCVDSRQYRYYMKITKTKTIDEYRQAKDEVICYLKKDFQKSKKINVNWNAEREQPSICGHYQQLNCKILAPHSENYKTRKHIMRHHICDFCYYFLNEKEQHPGAECTLFKKFDNEFNESDLRHKLNKQSTRKKSN